MKSIKTGRRKLLVQDGERSAVTLLFGGGSDLSVFRLKGAFLFFLGSSLQTWKSWINIFLLSQLAVDFASLSGWKMVFFYRLNIFVLQGSWFFFSRPSSEHVGVRGDLSSFLSRNSPESRPMWQSLAIDCMVVIPYCFKGSMLLKMVK